MVRDLRQDRLSACRRWAGAAPRPCRRRDGVEAVVRQRGPSLAVRGLLGCVLGGSDPRGRRQGRLQAPASAMASIGARRSRGHLPTDADIDARPRRASLATGNGMPEVICHYAAIPGHRRLLSRDAVGGGWRGRGSAPTAPASRVAITQLGAGVQSDPTWYAVGPAERLVLPRGRRSTALHPLAIGRPCPPKAVFRVRENRITTRVGPRHLTILADRRDGLAGTGRPYGRIRVSCHRSAIGYVRADKGDGIDRAATTDAVCRETDPRVTGSLAGCTEIVASQFGWACGGGSANRSQARRASPATRHHPPAPGVAVPSACEARRRRPAPFLRGCLPRRLGRAGRRRWAGCPLRPAPTGGE